MPNDSEASGVSPATRSPWMKISPSLGGWAPAMILIMVLLPQPFSPSR
jgi:hypothetical protein